MENFTEKLLKAGRQCLMLEVIGASAWAIAAGCAFGFTMADPGEGASLAVKLICLMVDTAAAATYAKGAAGSIKLMHKLKHETLFEEICVTDEDSHTDSK